MNADELRYRIDPGEFRFTASRSSGPGGQNINKVNTRIELRMNIPSSPSFTDTEKERILDLLKNRITNEGDLLVVSQSERTQLRNKRKAEERLCRLLAKALTIKPERKATRPTTASKAKRLETKKKRSLVKRLRRDAPEIS